MKKKIPKILVAGILDTKENEVRYIANQVKACGGHPIILEVSVGKEVGWADIGLREIIFYADPKLSLEEFLNMKKIECVNIIIEGGKILVNDLIRTGKADGIIGIGGGMGSSIITSIMQSLPIGIPKLMVSTLASGDTRLFIGTKDICMMYPIAEIGVNSVTRKIFNNAAGSIVGMCSAAQPKLKEEKKIIGCMILGVTTISGKRAADYLENKGYDVMTCHATGIGGRAMEEMISDGHIAGILDITTSEIISYVINKKDPDYNNNYPGSCRLTAAGLKGIPQVVSTGGLDLFTFRGAINSVPKKYMSQINKLPGRGLIAHNTASTAVGTTLEEAYIAGKYIAEQLNKAIGPSVICVPMRGFSAYDSSGKLYGSGWIKDDPSPFWIPNPDRPEQSLRAVYFLKGLKEIIDLDKNNLDVLVMDYHINEPECADIIAEILEEMLLSKWKKNSHQNLNKVIKF